MAFFKKYLCNLWTSCISFLKKPKMFLVVGNDYYSPIINQLPDNVLVCSISSIEEYSTFVPDCSKICVTHEEALEAIRHKMRDIPNSRAMELFRDKGALRLMLKPMYSDFSFRKIKIYDLSKQKLSFKARESKYIVKPVKGFFGIGVRIISSDTCLTKLEKEISDEIEAQITSHPEYLKDGSLSVEDFLLEEYVGSDVSDLYSLENAEIAVDGYYNEEGKFILLNIYHHPYQKERKYFHLLYYTSKELFEKFSAAIIGFFNGLQMTFKLGICSFPVHAEFRIYDGKLFLLEINPGRFGGLGLSDLIYYSFGLNPYEFFFFDKSFDWQKIWDNNESYFGWVLVYKGADFVHRNVAFNHKKFQDFIGSGLLKYAPIDYDDSISAIAFIKKDSKLELERILSVEFNDYHSA